MTDAVARTLKKTKPFASIEQEALLGLLLVAARLEEPWVAFLKAEADLSGNQYNVLRILRGSHPARISCSDIASRMLDRLEKRGLVKRFRREADRRVVEIGITGKGLRLTSRLDADELRMPKALVGHLGPARLRQLTGLLDEVLGGLGTFP